MLQTQEEREAAWKQMLVGLDDFLNLSASYKDTENKPNIVDVTGFPWVYRLYTIAHYKGLSVDGELKNKVEIFLKKMEAVPAGRDSLAEKDKLLETYARYADGTARSQVGVAVMQGKEAHVV